MRFTRRLPPRAGRVRGSCYAFRMATQLLLFSSDQDLQPDGSIVVRPRKLVDGREISAGAAARMLGFRDKDTVCRMVQAGVIRFSN